MSKDKSPTGHKHDASDRALDQSATAEQALTSSDTHGADDTRKHDDAGKDRLFEGRQQHDEAEKNSEKSRLAKDIDKHHHTDAEIAGDASSTAKS